MIGQGLPELTPVEIVGCEVSEAGSPQALDYGQFTYYDEISTTVILADILGMDLECGDNKGNTWVINGNNKSLLNIVNQDITDYISGEKQSLYSYKIIEDENMQKYIDNFNDNMKHISISGENGAGIPIQPKTISEGEGMEEFQEIKDLDELLTYMRKLTKDGEYYLYALAIIGLDGSSFNGRITFDMGDGTEHIIHESGRISIGELFFSSYRNYEYQRDEKAVINTKKPSIIIETYGD